MGIQNLLKNLQSIEEDRHIRQYQNKRLAVDGYSWLHKAVYSSGYDIVIQKDYTKFLKNILARVQVIWELQIHLVLVFDGDKLPMKDNTEDKREDKRLLNKQKAMLLLQEGNYDAANRKFAESIDVTPKMAFQVVQFLKQWEAKKIKDKYGFSSMNMDNLDEETEIQKKSQLEVIVAPYEADSQLAYLSINGYVDGVITEDSDLLCFGTKVCLFKMSNEYNLKQVQLKNIYQTSEMPISDFSFMQFVFICILSGCDYLESPKQVALKTAVTLFNKNNKDIEKVFEFLEKKGKINETYVKSFKRAFLTFQHQIVYCPIQKKHVHMKPFPSAHVDSLENNQNQLQEVNCKEGETGLDKKGIVLQELKMLQNGDLTMKQFNELIETKQHLKWYQENKEDISFLGTALDEQLAQDIAECRTDPISKEAFQLSEDDEFRYDTNDLSIGAIKQLAYKRYKDTAYQQKVQQGPQQQKLVFQFASKEVQPVPYFNNINQTDDSNRQVKKELSEVSTLNNVQNAQKGKQNEQIFHFFQKTQKSAQNNFKNDQKENKGKGQMIGDQSQNQKKYFETYQQRVEYENSQVQNKFDTLNYEGFAEQRSNRFEKDEKINQMKLKKQNQALEIARIASQTKVENELEGSQGVNKEQLQGGAYDPNQSAPGLEYTRSIYEKIRFENRNKDKEAQQSTFRTAFFKQRFNTKN